MENFTPFNQQEHDAFLEALEQYGEGNTGREWQLISDAIGTRLPQEVMLYAHRYYISLQEITNDPVLDDNNWTFEEETVFENGMATFEEGDIHRWNKIAALLPEKSPSDVRRRYQKLMHDISRIESGMKVTVQYKVKKRIENPSSSTSLRGKMYGTSAAAALAAVIESAMEDSAKDDLALNEEGWDKSVHMKEERTSGGEPKHQTVKKVDNHKMASPARTSRNSSSVHV